MSRQASVPCGCSRPRCALPRRFFVLVAAEADLATPPAWIILAGELPVTAEWKRALIAAIARMFEWSTLRGSLHHPRSCSKEPRRNAARRRGCASGTTCLPPIADLAGIERALEAALAD